VPTPPATPAFPRVTVRVLKPLEYLQFYRSSGTTQGLETEPLGSVECSGSGLTGFPRKNACPLRAWRRGARTPLCVRAAAVESVGRRSSYSRRFASSAPSRRLGCALGRSRKRSSDQRMGSACALCPARTAAAPARATLRAWAGRGVGRGLARRRRAVAGSRRRVGQAVLERVGGGGWRRG